MYYRRRAHDRLNSEIHYNHCAYCNNWLLNHMLSYIMVWME